MAEHDIAAAATSIAATSVCSMQYVNESCDVSMRLVTYQCLLSHIDKRNDLGPEYDVAAGATIRCRQRIVVGSCHKAAATCATTSVPFMSRINESMSHVTYQ